MRNERYTRALSLFLVATVIYSSGFYPGLRPAAAEEAKPVRIKELVRIIEADPGTTLW